MKRLPVLALPALVILFPAPLLAAALTDAEQSAICGTRQSCEVMVVSDAGVGAGNVPLRVAELVLGLDDQSGEGHEDGCRSTDAALNSGALDGGREFWLLAGDAPPQQILALCNDGYGSAGMGEDVVEIGRNSLTHHQYGGSAWRWTVVKQIRLSPLTLVREESCSFHNVSPGSGRLTVADSTTLSARQYGWVTAGISEDDYAMGCPEALADVDEPLPPQPQGDTLGAYAVPAPFAADARQLPEGTTLGSCGLALSTDGSNGFLVHGDAAPAANAAELRVIAETDSSLLIQIHDPLAAANADAGSWVKQPHVEIWTAREGGGDTQLDYIQIGITLDGAVHAGKGRLDKLPLVSVWPGRDAQGRNVTVMRVNWRDAYGFPDGLGVVYSQAEGGRQARLVANAPIDRNTPLFLPHIWFHYPELSGIANGGCEYSGESLQLDL